MAGPSRPNNAVAAAARSAANKTEMTTLASGASYPTFLEPLTKNEMALLDTYERIKHYEKEAARLKAEEAKRRLEEANERYQAKVREREKAEGKGSDDGDGDGDEKSRNKDDDGRAVADPSDDDDDEHDDDSDEDQDEAAIERRKERAREIKQLRREVDAAKQKENQEEAKKEAAKRKEEAMRRSHLGGGDEDGDEGTKKRSAGGGGGYGDDSDGEDDSDNDERRGGWPRDAGGPSIKKKRAEPSNPWDEKPKPSLIANMGGDSTPVHDFSKKLGMSKISLDGSVLFPVEGNLPWEPPAQPADFLDGCLELELPDFDSSAGSHSGNNTIAVKFHAPQESKRFSINIAAPNHDGYNDILFHFNPRHFKKGGQLVINDRKESMWGNDISVPLSQLPLMYGVQSCTLIIQIIEEGFDVFVEGQHCARLEHRTVLPQGKGPLFLQFPSSDDYGNPENWMVYRVWWGRKRGMADVLDGVAGVDIYSSVHPKKLFLSGLQKLRSDPEVDLRKAELERAFRRYGGPAGAVVVSVQKNSTFAFVEVASERQADLALVQMASKYRVNKARRTKHEALMEERAAKEAKEKGTKKESVEWD